jgi:hypothetical protein
MSNQEMQFADPDWEPTRPGQQSPTYTPQPVNDDRRERFQQPVGEMPPAPEENYTGYAGAQPEQFRQPPAYQYPQRPYRRRRSRAWFWIIVIILFFSLTGGGVSALGSIGQKSVTQDHTFNNLPAGTPTIVINESAGNIHVSRGNSLDIQDVKHSGLFDDPNNINVKFDTSGSTITVSVDEGFGFLSARSVDFNVTVPENVNLQLKTTSGDISVDNADGSMTLQATSGNITTTNDTFVGDAILNTTSGDIQSTNDVFSNNASLSTTSGDISMHQDTLNGSAKVNATSGDIDFTGTLASSTTPNVSYQFTAISGDIHVGLPANASFNVQADTTSGSIDAGDFPSINVQDAHHGSGSHADGSVGSPGGPSITINTTSGDITIHQQ